MIAPPSDSEVFTVVGIGASAGGLEALRAFFEKMPPDSGMAFVVVVHLAPGRQSHMPELLQSRTQMPVTHIHQDEKIEPNHVYVIPPNRNLSTIDTHLRLSPLEEAPRHRAPIDHFFRTLADTHGSKAVGIVLSGGGSDGTLGLREIKAAGGFVIAQEPADADFDGMPQSAIGTGVVDFVLPVTEMPARLIDYVSKAEKISVPDDAEALPDTERETLQKILVQVRTGLGHDFSRYKQSTLLRRIARRMQIRGVDTMSGYLELLRRDGGEVRNLFQDLLINVTNFFRDPKAYEVLEREVIPHLFGSKKAGDEVRIWVAGCATGEEAYSLGILLLEQAARTDRPVGIQIFATDLSEASLHKGRDGSYPESIADDLSEERLQRFFIPEREGYRVRQDLREIVIFAPHNLLKDPPFLRLDLISCRNLLIYLERDVQQQIFELFHYALRPDGYLFLGTAESADGGGFFRTISKKHSIYQRHNPPEAERHLPPLAFATPHNSNRIRPVRAERQTAGDYGGLHEQMAEQFAPPSVLVNQNHEAVHYSAHAGRYLHIPGGGRTDNLLLLVRGELRVELTAALHQAIEQKQASHSEPIEVMLDGEQRFVSLYVQPATGQEGFALVFFLESMTAIRKARGEPWEGSGAMVDELKEELAFTRQRLQATVEEYETSMEEMKAANEELQSMNEELRSMTEELETSKEELQSMNEELLTVNQENKNKVDELSRLTSDLQNLLAASDIATIFLDRDLHIKRFTPRAAELFNMLRTDRGRPLAHITHKLGYEGVLDDATRVLKSLVPVEREMRSDAGQSYLMRIVPYRTVEDRIDGVVVTFVDITAVKDAERALHESRERYRLMVENVKEYAIFTMDQAGRIANWNPGAERILGFTEEEALGQPGAIIFTEEDRQAGAPEAELERAAEAGQAIDERWHVRKNGSRFWGTGVVTALRDEGQLRGFAKLMRDNTQRKQAEEQVRQSQERLQALNETLEERVRAQTEQVRALASELVASEQKVRHRISQVLHDDLQQMLYAMEMQLQFATEDLQAQTPPEPARLEQIEKMIQQAIRLTRQLSVELSPPVLQGEGLRQALNWLAEHMRELYNLEVSIEASGERRVASEEKRILLFQVVRELLFNVVKHAGVNQARVILETPDDTIRIRVEDAGKGFEAEPALEGGLGLYHVRERVRLFGGDLEIDSIPGDGARVAVFVPMHERIEDEMDAGSVMEEEG